MRLETAVIVTKDMCLTYIPLGTTIATGLPELELTHIAGVPIKVIVLVASATVAGAGGLLAFLSQSFGNYMTARAGNGNTAFLAKPATPPNP